MPKVAEELTALDVRRLTHPGNKRNVLFSVGGVPGLHLQITPRGGRSWVLRVSVGTLRRDIGLGGFPGVTLSQARDKAREARAKIESGVDPVEERKAAKAALVAAQRRGLTFADAVDKCLAAKLEAYKNAKHRQQWENTLATYATPDLGKMLVQDITTQDVLRVLQPLWMDKTETASRLRGRIETVLSWATVAGHRTGDNPARWAGNLKELLPPPSKVANEGNHPALALDDAARWFEALQTREGFGARALEFLALTGTRSQEVRGAGWDEIDMDKALWVIPGARMKMGKEHRVRWCQTDSNRSPQGQYGCPLCDAKVAPLCKSGGAVLLENGPGGEAAFLVEMVGDGGVDGGEFLQTSHASEPEHRPLPSSERQV